MKSIQSFNKLEGQTVSREHLQGILKQAQAEEQTHIAQKIKGLLEKYPKASHFEISLKKKEKPLPTAQGLALPMTPEIRKKAFTGKRLNKGWRYVKKGFISNGEDYYFIESQHPKKDLDNVNDFYKDTYNRREAIKEAFALANKNYSEKIDKEKQKVTHLFFEKQVQAGNLLKKEERYFFKKLPQIAIWRLEDEENIEYPRITYDREAYLNLSAQKSELFLKLLKDLRTSLANAFYEKKSPKKEKTVQKEKTIQKEKIKNYKNAEENPPKKAPKTRDFTKDLPSLESLKSSYRWLSFDPDVRAKNELAGWQQTAEKLFAWVNEVPQEKREEYLAFVKQKYKSLLNRKLAVISARAKAVNMAVAGGAGVKPRDIKNTDAYYKKESEFYDLVEKTHEILQKYAKKIEKNKSTAKSALELLQEKLAEALEEKAYEKKANEALKLYLKTNDETVFAKNGIKEDDARVLINWKRPYSMAILNADILKIKKDIERLQNIGQKTEIQGVRVEENAQENRLQIFFDFVPSEELRQKLKKASFKWSPRNKCWQRQLTVNAIRAWENIAKGLKSEGKQALNTQGLALPMTPEIRKKAFTGKRLNKGWRYLQKGFLTDGEEIYFFETEDFNKDIENYGKFNRTRLKMQKVSAELEESMLRRQREEKEKIPPKKQKTVKKVKTIQKEKIKTYKSAKDFFNDIKKPSSEAKSVQNSLEAGDRDFIKDLQAPVLQEVNPFIARKYTGRLLDWQREWAEDYATAGQIAPALKKEYLALVDRLYRESLPIFRKYLLALCELSNIKDRNKADFETIDNQVFVKRKEVRALLKYMKYCNKDIEPERVTGNLSMDYLYHLRRLHHRYLALKKTKNNSFFIQTELSKNEVNIVRKAEKEGILHNFWGYVAEIACYIGNDFSFGDERLFFKDLIDFDLARKNFENHKKPHIIADSTLTELMQWQEFWETLYSYKDDVPPSKHKDFLTLFEKIYEPVLKEYLKLISLNEKYYNNYASKGTKTEKEIKEYRAKHAALDTVLREAKEILQKAVKGLQSKGKQALNTQGLALPLTPEIRKKAFTGKRLNKGWRYVKKGFISNGEDFYFVESQSIYNDRKTISAFKEENEKREVAREEALTNIYQREKIANAALEMEENRRYAEQRKKAMKVINKYIKAGVLKKYKNFKNNNRLYFTDFEEVNVFLADNPFAEPPYSCLDVFYTGDEYSREEWDKFVKIYNKINAELGGDRPIGLNAPYIENEQDTDFFFKPEGVKPPAEALVPARGSIYERLQANREKNFTFFNIENPELATFLGKLERKQRESLVITIGGSAGSGKTRFSFQFINELAKNYRVGHASMEEHPESKLYFDKVEQYLSPEAMQNTEAPEIKTAEDLAQLIERNDVIVIDSFEKLRELDPKFGLDKDLRKKYDGKLFLVVYQLTTDGKMRGGSKSEFDGDVILLVEKFPDYRENYVYPTKNRYNSLPANELRFNIYSGQMLGSPENQPVQEIDVFV